MKKFLGILAAAMVAIISVFNLSENYKNSAEPQYFTNSKVQKQIVQDNENTYTIYLNNNVEISLDNNIDNDMIFELNSSTEVIALNNDIEYNLTFLFELEPTSQLQIMTSGSPETYLRTWIGPFAEIYNIDMPEDNLLANQWYSITSFNANTNTIEYNEITAVKFINVSPYFTDLAEINSELEPLIGTVNLENDTPEPETPTETTPLTQIGSIITDTIGWFTNILTGLSAAFYIDGELTTWGTVLFIGVAITLIAMVLKWLISLIKGVLIYYY